MSCVSECIKPLIHILGEPLLKSQLLSIRHSLHMTFGHYLLHINTRHLLNDIFSLFITITPEMRRCGMKEGERPQ